jgi:polyphosphate kinase 2 (PPK2 family)
MAKKDNDHAESKHNGVETNGTKKEKKLKRKAYDAELIRMQTELVKLAAWVKERNLRVVALFEGRDAAGKGGSIKRITEAISPRLCRRSQRRPSAKKHSGTSSVT